jgi:DNA-binding response OmpR family regulator
LRVLVIEDEPMMGRALVRGLKAERWTVDLVKDGEAGLERAGEGDYDVIILDWNLPKLDGVSVLRQLRRRKIHTPILMLTARSGVSDRVYGLKVGADDYLVKPFAFRELLARIQGLLRRPSGFVGKLTVADLELDRGSRTVTRAGTRIALTPLEYGVLEYLMLNAGRPVTREMLIEHAWNFDFEGDSHAVDTYINRLREKVDRGFGKPLIRTAVRVGFVLTDQADSPPDQADASAQIKEKDSTH